MSTGLVVHQLDTVIQNHLVRVLLSAPSTNKKTLVYNVLRNVSLVRRTPAGYSQSVAPGQNLP